MHINFTLLAKASWLFLIFIILQLLPVKQMFSQIGDKTRVAIVYDASSSGIRYKEGIMTILENKDNLEIIDVAYIKPSIGEDTIKNLIRGNHVDVILGPTESEVFSKVYNTDGISDNKISVISGLATTGVGNDSQGYFFRLNLEATSRVFEVWSYMNKFWISKIAVIYEDSEFGRNAELAFADLIRDSYSASDYLSIPFESPESPRTEVKNIIRERPEVIGLFCGRDDIHRLYRDIQLLNTSGVPYNPYFFSIIDITSVGDGLNNFFFPSLQAYGDTANIEGIKEDEVFILGQATGSLLVKALEESGKNNDLSTADGRVHFRNQIVGILRGESKGGISMNFLKMKNLGPPYLYKLSEDIVYEVEHDKDINWITMVQSKISLVYATHSYKLIINLLLMLILTLSVSSTEIRRSFPKKHVKIYYTSVFYYYLLAHLALVLFLFIYLAETGRVNYSDTLMAIIITITPSAFFKTTFFETRSGNSFGLESIYKKIMARIDEKIMNARYKKLVGLENVIAYSNSEDTMRSALFRIYRNNPSKIQSAKLIQQMEESLSGEKDYMSRRRAAAKLIMRQFDKEQLKAEGFVPANWDYKKNIDPVILIRHAAKYCANDKIIREKVLKLVDSEFEELRGISLERHKELDAIHKKELKITMSKEAELLVKLRLLFVIRGFSLNYIQKNIIPASELMKYGIDIGVFEDDEQKGDDNNQNKII